jgi:rubredoxin
MRDYNLIRINFAGGLVSPNELQKILSIIKNLGIDEVRFGLRQQLFLHVPPQLMAQFEMEMNAENIAYKQNDNAYPNIISSYAGEEIFQQGNWLTEGIYKDVLDSFDYEPRLKINLSDQNQSFTPYFSGHLNFVASDIPNFWHLSIRLPKTNEVFAHNRLIFSNEIAKTSQILEKKIDEGISNHLEIFAYVPPNTISLPAEKPLELHPFRLPYYEGLNRYGRKSWLGIYRRDELFSVDFLMEICKICLETKIGQFCITSWKSIIVKGIEEKDRKYWSNLLAKYSINVRHAANELNWQVEDDSDEALELKQSIVKYFDKWDLRTFGLCFGIKTKPKTEVFASIMVRKRRFKLFNVIPTFNVYDISYTKDFDPNGRTKVYFAEGVLRLNLNEQLRRSISLYNKNLSENRIEKIENQLTITNNKKLIITNLIHQCPTCFTVYDPAFGDILNGIEAGIAFKDLPESYCCPTCESAKSEFVEVEVEEILA